MPKRSRASRRSPQALCPGTPRAGEERDCDRRRWGVDDRRHELTRPKEKNHSAGPIPLGAGQGNGTLTEDDGGGESTIQPIGESGQQNYRCRSSTPRGGRGNGTPAEDDGVGGVNDVDLNGYRHSPRKLSLQVIYPPRRPPAYQEALQAAPQWCGARLTHCGVASWFCAPDSFQILAGPIWRYEN
jgi:hypothetical protein